MKGINEGKLKDKDDTINELRIRVSDFQRNLSLKQSEVENLKIQLSRANIKLENFSNQNEKSMHEGIERQLDEYINKYR